MVGCESIFMKTEVHPKYMDAEIRCACGNVIKTRSTKNTIIIGICNVCHPFYTGQQKFVDTAGRVDAWTSSSSAPPRRRPRKRPSPRRKRRRFSGLILFRPQAPRRSRADFFLP
jgi:large subunit ribosomal protein L31